MYYVDDEDEEEDDEEEDDEEQEEYEEDEQEEYNEDEDKFFILKIPQNQYLNQSQYDIKFRENTGELANYNPFTDTEFIATYYKPVKGYNIIKEYLFKSIRDLSDHLNKLVTINNSKMVLKNHDEENEIVMPINQSYILPNTSLVYFNSSLYDIQNYNIKEDLKVVIQLTFSCNIMYCYRIMKQLLSITNVENYEKQLNLYSTTNKNVKQISEKLYNVKNNLDYDDYAITTSMNIVNLLFNNYNNMYKTYPLDNESNITKIIKPYVFLIIYKLFIYLNSYIQNVDKSGNMLKKHLSFAVRHYNYALFLELKKILMNTFKIEGTTVSTIISQLLDDKILNKLYDSPSTKNQKTKLNVDIKNNPNLQSKYYGDPLFSIKSYFEYFDKFNDDWFVTNNIDEKSTKFDLKNDVIIIEFRDFPLYSYMELFIMANDKIKNEILQNNVGTLDMKSLNYFISK